MTTVALLGTGTMGTGMARRIAGAGLDLRVWNRSAGPAEALADVATVELDAAKAVQGADVVVTMVWDADSVTDVVRAATPGLAEGTLWLQTSTVGVEGARRLAGLAGEHSLVFVDSPVLGTKQPAAQGQLVVLAAGPERAKEQATPVFDAIGQRTIWVGEEPGQASALKLVVNSWLATVAESVAELLTATRALGLDPRLFLDAVKGGALDAPFVGLKGGAMLEGSFDPSFSVAGAAKDVGLAFDALTAAGLDTGDVAVLAAARQGLDRAVADGHGDLDVAAVYLSHQRGQA
jgi:3-hydroxyisobutyrate dehydrogenase